MNSQGAVVSVLHHLTPEPMTPGYMPGPDMRVAANTLMFSGLQYI